MFVVTYRKYLIAIRATLSHSLKSVELFTVVGWLNCLMYALEVVYFFTLCIAKTNDILITQKGLWTSSYNYVVRLAQKYMGNKALFKKEFKVSIKGSRPIIIFVRLENVSFCAGGKICWNVMQKTKTIFVYMKKQTYIISHYVR